MRPVQLPLESLAAFLSLLAKRVLDITAAAAGLGLLSPFFLFLAVLIRRDSPGPVFYRGPRAGRNGREFQILKFRSMRECAASYQGPRVTGPCDARVTPLGQWLRATKINELPQLWNVLKGEMSLVGPRPEDPEIASRWPEEVRREILSIRPGITSPASVLYRNEESLLRGQNLMEDYFHSVLPGKMRLDQLYVRHRSFWGDLEILFWTLLVILPAWRSRVPGEELLFLGPLSRIGRRYLNWFLADTLITFGSIGLAGIVWRLAGPLDVGWGPALVIALAFALLFSLTAARLGMHRIAWSQAWASDSLGLLVSAFLAGLFALWANQSITRQPVLPPEMIVFASALAAASFVVVRYRSRVISGFLYRWMERSGGGGAARERVLIVGGGATGQCVAWLLSRAAHSNIFRIVGFADDDLYKQGMQFQGIRVIGRRADIRRLVEQHDVGVIVFAIHNITAAERDQVLQICTATGARVLTVPDMIGSLNAVLLEKTGRVQESPETRTPPAAAAGPLFTAPGIPPVQVQYWLAGLEDAVDSGDLIAANDQIRSIRESMRQFRP